MIHPIAKASEEATESCLLKHTGTTLSPVGHV